MRRNWGSICGLMLFIRQSLCTEPWLRRLRRILVGRISHAFDPGGGGFVLFCTFTYKRSSDQFALTIWSSPATDVMVSRILLITILGIISNRPLSSRQKAKVSRGVRKTLNYPSFYAHRNDIHFRDLKLIDIDNPRLILQISLWKHPMNRSS